MNTIICTLGKRNKFTFNELVRDYKKFHTRKTPLIKEWRVVYGNNPKKILEFKDEVYFLKQGEKEIHSTAQDNIIFAKGVILSNEPYLKWIPSLQKYRYVIEIQIVEMVDPENLRNDGLRQSSIKSISKQNFWKAQSSGTDITAFIIQIASNWKKQNFIKAKALLSKKRISKYIPVLTEESFQESIANSKAKLPKIYSPKISNKTTSGWKRNPAIAKDALKLAGYLCENKKNHSTFQSKASGKQYVEAHHFLPMQYQDKYVKPYLNREISLDRQENIICLCPNCHRKFHSAIDKEKKQLIDLFLKRRKSFLQKLGIIIDQSELYEYYKCK
ncbi:MAG: HNH endonuclease [Flavobacteriales bacterium]